MKRLLILLSFLAFTIPSWAAIAPSAFQSCAQSTNTNTQCQASMTLATNDRVVLYVGAGIVGETYSVVDSCSNTWQHITGASFTQGSTAQLEAYVVDGAISSAACSITVTRTGTNTKFQWVAESYTGASAIGNATASGGTTTSTHSIALTTQDANNFVVAGYQSGAVKTFSASVGNLRGQVSTTSGTTIALNDNTAVSAGSVTNTVTTDTNSSMAKGAIELRGTGVSGRAAVADDSGATVAITCSVDCNYTLPGIPLSKRWNAIVTCQVAHTCTIVVNSPATLNGASSSIALKEWQSVRISTTNDGVNYRAEFLPLIAGTGLTVTPAANGITVLENTAAIHTFANTVRLIADSSSITATTAGTATTIFTFPTLTASTNYSFHCSGTTTQATAGAGIGIEITAGTNAATNLEAHARVATSASAAAFASSGNVTNTTATAVYTGSAGTLTTQLPFDVDGSIEVGGSVPTITIGFFSANASDAVVVKRDSYCTVMP